VRDRRHAEAAAWYPTTEESVATTPFVLAEVDHLALARAGAAAASAFRKDVRGGAYFVGWWDGAASEAVEVAEGYRDLGLGLTDASLVALARRLDTVRIATFDERHFRAVRPLSSEPAFELLPIDTQVQT
jgi:predicted nucleic acid-binding protein